MSDVSCTTQYLTSADVARLAIERGDSLTPAGVRLAAVSGRLHSAATTVGGVRLYAPADVEIFLRTRVTRHHRGAT